MFAVIDTIESIRPHPNGDRIEVIKLSSGVELVTGKHYRPGLKGIHLKPGSWVPGWLAAECWLPSTDWFEVRSMPIRGVQSPGIFVGSEYRSDGSKASTERYDALAAAGGKAEAGWITWPFWRKSWKDGDVVDSWLGVRPVFGGSFAAPVYASLKSGERVELFSDLARRSSGFTGTFTGTTGAAAPGLPINTNPANQGFAVGGIVSGIGPRVAGESDHQHNLVEGVLPDPRTAAAILPISDHPDPLRPAYCARCGNVTANPPSQLEAWCTCAPLEDAT